MSVTGVTTFTGNVDVDAHTHLDNVNISGVTTFASNVDIDGNTTFGANGSITSSADFHLSSNSLRVTGGSTVVGEFKGTSIPTVQVTQTTNNSDLQLRANSEGGLVRTATNYPLILGANQREKLRIAGGSYATIGINTSTFDNAGSQLKIEGRGTGTTSPPYLQIKGVGTIGGIDQGLNTTGVITATSFVGSGANLTNLPAQATIANNADNRIITGGSGVNLNAESNVLYDGTNFGIGKSPSRTLDVQGKIRSSDSVCFGDNSSTPSEGVAIHRPAASTLALVTNNTERLRITNAGIIGIGTDAPYTNGLLHCDGHLVLTAAGNAPKIIFDEYGTGTDPKAQIEMDQTDSTNASLKFYTEGSGTLTERLRITSAGLMGLGTGSPSDALEISHATDPAIRLHYGTNSG